MKKIFLPLVLLLLVNTAFPQVASHVVVAEVFGGGGNAGAPYLNDYVILYNPTGASVNLSGMSVQFASATSSAYSVTNLTGSIPAGSYYMIQEAAGSFGDGVPLPFHPDVTGSFFISPLGGKVAFVSNTIAITGLADPDVIDFVGYGTANESEGGSPASAGSDVTSIRRKDNSGNNTYGTNGSGWDSGVNANDFYVQGSLNLIANYPLASTSFANHLVIAEVYGGGGLTNASYENDYVVLYNPSSFGQDISTWSLQYANATNTNWAVINLNGTVAPHTYYLIQLFSSGTTGNPLPTPNLIGTTNIRQNRGKLALVRTQTVLSGANPITSRTDIADFVGWGAADGFEGSAPAASLTNNTSSLRRKDNNGNNTYGLTNGSGWDSNNNSNDSYIETNIIANPPLGSNFLANQVVIAEIYGGGGNPGATYTNDYIVLYNPTALPVDLSTWSLQYHTATLTTGSWSKLNLTQTIGAQSYYLVRFAALPNGIPLPIYPNDSTTAFGLGNSSGKVALVSNQTALIGDFALPNANVVDFVGYGTTATMFEGFGSAPGPANATSSIRRKDNSGNSTYGVSGSGWDSDNNNADFYFGTDLITVPPLPVELTSFSAVIISNAVHLNWETATEVNNYGFEVQKLQSELSSAEWESLGFIEGYGNSNSPKQYSFVDNAINGAQKFSYRLKQIDNDGAFEYSKIIEVDVTAPIEFSLSQNYPNPFNPSTTIKYSIPAKEFVSLKVFNILGKEVAELVNSEQAEGFYNITFDGSRLSSGVYFYKLQAGSFTAAHKMLLVK
jgi:hypothetical protein